MIFYLTKDVLDFDNEWKARLMLAIANALEHSHFVDPGELGFDWLDENLFDNNALFSPQTRELLLSDQEHWDPKAIHKRHLSSFYVGNEDKKSDRISPLMMNRLVTFPSLVFVENSRYDGAALVKFVHCYRNDFENRSINELVNHAFKQGYIVPGNGGGCDNIHNAIFPLKNVFKGYHQVKITAVFDSDKTSAEDTEDHKKSLKSELDNLGIKYHELRKREIENYFHPSTYMELGLALPGKDLTVIEPEEWDFIETNEKSKFVKMEKKDVVRLAQATTQRLLRERVYWKERQQDEIHEIILLLARYV